MRERGVVTDDLLVGRTDMAIVERNKNKRQCQSQSLLMSMKMKLLMKLMIRMLMAETMSCGESAVGQVIDE